MKRALLMALVLGWSAPSWAQEEEIISDPENVDAAVTADVVSDRETSNVRAPDNEDISDPENEDLISDPENEVLNPNNRVGAKDTSDPFAEQDSAFSSASFVGLYRSRTWVDTVFDGGDEDVFEQFTDLDLKLEYDVSNDVRVVLEGEFRHWFAVKENGKSPRASYDARLGEAYVLWRANRWSFTLGNQIITWGATDLARPGDVVNPRDLTIITPTGDLEKVPQLTADVSYAGESWAVQMLLVPFFTPNRVWAFGRDTAILNANTNPLVAEKFPVVPLLSSIIDDSIQDDIQPLVMATRVPDETPENVSLGGRITATFLNTDIGLGYFFGWDRTTFLSIDDNLVEVLKIAEVDGQFLDDFDFLGFVQRNPEVLGLVGSITDSVVAGEDLFASEYRRLHTVQADFTRYLGPIGVRADVMFQPATTYLDADLKSVRRPTFSAALGVSYEDFSDESDALALTLEGFYTKPLSAESSVTQTFVDAAERGTNDAMFIFGEQAAGVQGAVAWSIPGPKLQITLGTIAYLSNSDVLIGGSISRRWFTWLRTSVAGLFFESYGQNDRLTLGTLYDQNDYMGLEIDGFF